MGAMAKANPFRFSNKYQDEETDCIYYGYRYYNASNGRWVSRDPIEELGGQNLYSAFNNDAIGNVDPNGKVTLVEGVALLVIVTVATAVIVHVGLKANKPIHKVPINHYILQHHIETGGCKGAVDIPAHGTIEWHPAIDVLSQGFSLEVAAARAYWKATGMRTMHVWVYAYAEVKGQPNVRRNTGKVIEEWTFTSDNLCCKDRQ